MAGRPRLAVGTKGAYNLSRLEKKKRVARNKLKQASKAANTARESIAKLNDQQSSLNSAKKLMGKGGLALEEQLDKLPKHVQKTLDKHTQILFSPNNGPQTDFLAAPEKEVLYGGAAGGG